MKAFDELKNSGDSNFRYATPLSSYLAPKSLKIAIFAIFLPYFAVFLPFFAVFGPYRLFNESTHKKSEGGKWKLLMS